MNSALLIPGHRQTCTGFNILHQIGLNYFVAETSEILVSREFSRIFFHFHFSFSISSRFNFTFTSRKRVKGFYFSLFTSRKKWKLSIFHSFFSRKKEWNQMRGITSPLSLFPIVLSNIAKGTTDPRVEFLSQVQTQILIKFHLQNLDTDQPQNLNQTSTSP